MAKRGVGHARRCRRPLAQTKARMGLQLAAQKLGDLRAWKRGDDNRFGRMVDGRGQQLGSPEQWVAQIRAALSDPDAQKYQAGVVKRIGRALAALGYAWPSAHN